jgi:hypothetical protein
MLFLLCDFAYTWKSTIALFAQYCLGYKQFFCFYMNFKLDFSVSYREISYSNVIVILIVIALSIQIAFGSMDSFMVLILLIHEHERSFHLLIYSSVSFFSGLQFLL